MPSVSAGGSAAGGFSLSIEGMDAVLKRLEQVGQNASKAAEAALYQEANAIMTASKRVVPVDTGVLRGSGYVSKPKNTSRGYEVELGYGGPAAPYALSVHENPRSGKTDGITPGGHERRTWAKVGEWKYLERPFLEAENGMLVRMAESIAKNAMR